VYMFHRTGTNTWIQNGKLSSLTGTSGEGFGNSVSMDGEAVIVGVYDGGGMPDLRGTAFLFWP
jgi:hypothetical protein